MRVVANIIEAIPFWCVMGVFAVMVSLDYCHVVDHDRVRWVQQGVQPLRDLRKFHPVRLEDLLEEGVAVDEFLLVLILQLVRLDVLPERGYDDWPSLSVDPEQPC